MPGAGAVHSISFGSSFAVTIGPASCIGNGSRTGIRFGFPGTCHRAAARRDIARPSGTPATGLLSRPVSASGCLLRRQLDELHRRRRDLDPPGPQGLGKLALQIDDQEAIAHYRAADLDVVGEVEDALEAARRDPTVEVLVAGYSALCL